MTRTLSNDEALTHVMRVLRDSFGPDVGFELTRESDSVYRVKASSSVDTSITDGLEKMKAARLRSDFEDGVAVKMISTEDAKEYRTRAASSADPTLRQGYTRVGQEAEL